MKRRLQWSLAAVGAFAVGIGVGWALRGGAPPPGAPGARAPAQVWTCSMHPQVRLPAPGKCPICGMDLIPAGDPAPGEKPEAAAPVLALSDHALAMAGVETAVAERRALSRELRAVGKIEVNETALATITPRVDGVLEKLFVNITGTEIKAGDHLAEIYSPELLVAQRELLIARQAGGDAALLETARTKLRLLGLTAAQIRQLEEERRVSDRITLYSPITGTVIEKMAVEKAAFKAGDPLYRIANLDSVWVYLEIYELDLPWLRHGQKVVLRAEALPGRTFEGRVSFVQPVVTEATRTVRVPVFVANPDRALKPGMFVSAVVQAALGGDGQAAPTGIEGRFTCPMHPQVLRDAAGACAECGMALERIPGAALSAAPAWRCPMKCEGDKTYAEAGTCPVCKMELTPAPAADGKLLAVPASAVLDSGTRQLAFVEVSRGTFAPRELVLGPKAGDWYPVLQGLRAGEKVVVRGNFLLDSQFQISGLPSLLQPGGARAAPTHVHGGAAPAPRAPQEGDGGTASPSAAPQHRH